MLDSGQPGVLGGAQGALHRAEDEGGKEVVPRGRGRQQEEAAILLTISIDDFMTFTFDRNKHFTLYLHIISNEVVLSLQMSVHDSYVVLGDRRSLPLDVVDSTGGLRHRSSHSSGTMSPPAAGDAVLDLSASKFRYR